MRIILALAASLTLSACGNMAQPGGGGLAGTGLGDPCSGMGPATITGAAIGASALGGASYLMGGGRSWPTMLGAGAGALGGVLTGQQMDSNTCQLHRQQPQQHPAPAPVVRRTP